MEMASIRTGLRNIFSLVLPYVSHLLLLLFGVRVSSTSLEVLLLPVVSRQFSGITLGKNR